MEHDSFDDQTWKDLLVYLDTNTIPNTENDENYWWFYRDFEVNH